jgi:hypothetical protein
MSETLCLQMVSYAVAPFRGSSFLLDQKGTKKSTAAFFNDPLRGRSLKSVNLSLRDFKQNRFLRSLSLWGPVSKR